MRIKIKGKDYSKLDISSEGTLVIEPVDSDRKIAEVVAWAFLCDIEDGRYVDYIQEIRKPNGKEDEDKKKILIRNESNSFKLLGIVGVLRNKKFKPTDGHKDDIEWYLKYNGLEDDKERILSDLEDKSFDITLQIGSRFDSDNNQFFLESMFIDEPFDFKDIYNDVPPNEESILDFLMLILFRLQLQRAYENGPYRKYVRYEKNDSKPKGSIDVARHIKLNIGLNNGRVAYSYRENTPDNHITHLIIHAFEHALKYFPEYAYSIFFSGDMPVAGIIKELKSLSPSFDKTNVKLDISKSDSVVDHPYYHKYEALRKTCLMLLRFDGLSMFDGTDEDVQGILFYIPTLWENFLDRQFKRLILPPFNSRFNSQHCSKVYVYKGKEEGSKDTYPDYVFFLDDEKQAPLMVLDAKFRKIWADNYGSETLPDLGDFTKCVRDMCALGTRYVGVIFPKESDEKMNEENEEYKKYKISSRNKSIFYTVPVKIPDSRELKNYSEWKKQFNINLHSAANNLSDILEKARDSEIERMSLFTKIKILLSDSDDISELEQIFGLKNLESNYEL